MLKISLEGAAAGGTVSAAGRDVGGILGVVTPQR